MNFNIEEISCVSITGENGSAPQRTSASSKSHSRPTQRTLECGDRLSSQLEELTWTRMPFVLVWLDPRRPGPVACASAAGAVALRPREGSRNTGRERTRPPPAHYSCVCLVVAAGETMQHAATNFKHLSTDISYLLDRMRRRAMERGPPLLH